MIGFGESLRADAVSLPKCRDEPLPLRRRASSLLSVVVLFAACAKPAPPALIGRYVQQTFTARDDPSWRGVVGDWIHEFRSETDA
jgi:hypothetical protein